MLLHRKKHILGIIESERLKMASTGKVKASDELVAGVKSQDGIDARNMGRLEEVINQQHG